MTGGPATPTPDLQARVALGDDDPEVAVRALDGAVEARSEGAAAAAKAFLEDDRPRIRNAGALALVDLGASGAVNALRAALLRPGVAAQSGTLVYALRELGGSLGWAEVVAIAKGGSYEARAEMLESLQAGLHAPVDEITPAERDRLSALADEGEAGWAASQVLEVIAVAGPAPPR